LPSANRRCLRNECSRALSFSSDALIMVSFTDSDENIQKLLPFLDEMVHEGLIAMSEGEVIKY
jgi:PII-like signaling protein